MSSPNVLYRHTGTVPTLIADFLADVKARGWWVVGMSPDVAAVYAKHVRPLPDVLVLHDPTLPPGIVKGMPGLTAYLKAVRDAGEDPKVDLRDLDTSAAGDQPTARERVAEPRGSAAAKTPVTADIWCDELARQCLEWRANAQPPTERITLTMEGLEKLTGKIATLTRERDAAAERIRVGLDVDNARIEFVRTIGVQLVQTITRLHGDTAPDGRPWSVVPVGEVAQCLDAAVARSMIDREEAADRAIASDRDDWRRRADLADDDLRAIDEALDLDGVGRTRSAGDRVWQIMDLRRRYDALEEDIARAGLLTRNAHDALDAAGVPPGGQPADRIRILAGRTGMDATKRKAIVHLFAALGVDEDDDDPNTDVLRAIRALVLGVDDIPTGAHHD